MPTLDAYDSFRVHFHRTYPQVAKAAECLVQDFNNILLQNPEIDTQSFEIEALFGRLHYAHHSTPRFDNGLTREVITEILSMLDSYSNWQSVTDWFLVYDYYQDHNSRVRVSYERGQQTVSATRKKLLSRRDFCYGTDSAEQWPLRRYLTRINIKLEEDVAPSQVPALSEFATVKISVRKVFVIPSSNVPGLQWRFEVIQFWTGDSVRAVEEVMQRFPPRWTVECEIVNMPPGNTLAEKEKFNIFAGLLLKMQDFLEFPPCYKMAFSSVSDVTSLPIFTTV